MAEELFIDNYVFLTVSTSYEICKVDLALVLSQKPGSRLRETLGFWDNAMFFLWAYVVGIFHPHTSV